MTTEYELTAGDFAHAFIADAIERGDVAYVDQTDAPFWIEFVRGEWRQAHIGQRVVALLHDLHAEARREGDRALARDIRGFQRAPALRQIERLVSAYAAQTPELCVPREAARENKNAGAVPAFSGHEDQLCDGKCSATYQQMQPGGCTSK